MCLFGLGEAHSVIVAVKDGVVLADEHVSQDPQGPGRGGDVQAHEATQTHRLSSLCYLDKHSRTQLHQTSHPFSEFENIKIQALSRLSSTLMSSVLLLL